MKVHTKHGTLLSITTHESGIIGYKVLLDWDIDDAGIVSNQVDDRIYHVNTIRTVSDEGKIVTLKEDKITIEK